MSVFVNILVLHWFCYVWIYLLNSDLFFSSYHVSGELFAFLLFSLNLFYKFMLVFCPLSESTWIGFLHTCLTKVECLMHITKPLFMTFQFHNVVFFLIEISILRGHFEALQYYFIYINSSLYIFTDALCIFFFCGSLCSNNNVPSTSSSTFFWRELKRWIRRAKKQTLEHA